MKMYLVYVTRPRRTARNFRALYFRNRYLVRDTMLWDFLWQQHRERGEKRVAPQL